MLVIAEGAVVQSNHVPCSNRGAPLPRSGNDVENKYLSTDIRGLLLDLKAPINTMCPPILTLASTQESNLHLAARKR